MLSSQRYVEADANVTALIFNLPNEILSKILSQLYQSFRQIGKPVWEFDVYELDIERVFAKARDFAPLATVCRRFNNNATPFLYSTLAVTNTDLPDPPCDGNHELNVRVRRS